MSWTDEYKHSKLFGVWSCSCCEAVMKLNNMLTLCYALFTLHTTHSVGTHQAVKPNNAVSHPGRPESPATLLSEPHSLYRLSYIQNTYPVRSVCRLVKWSVWCSAEHWYMTGSDRGQTYKLTVRFTICTLHHIYHDGMCGKCSIHGMHTDICTKFLVGELKTREDLRRIYIGGEIV